MYEGLIIAITHEHETDTNCRVCYKKVAYNDKNKGSSPQENSRKNSELQYITDLKNKTLNWGWPQCPSHQLKADFPFPRWLLYLSLLILSPTLPPHPTLSWWVSSPFHKENRNWENSHPVLTHCLKTPFCPPHRGTSFALYTKANSISCCTEDPYLLQNVPPAAASISPDLWTDKVKPFVSSFWHFLVTCWRIGSDWWRRHITKHWVVQNKMVYWEEQYCDCSGFCWLWTTRRSVFSVSLNRIPNWHASASSTALLLAASEAVRCL